MGVAAKKFCRLCGADVAGRKRVRDPAGNYYCDACYSAALDDTHSGSANADAEFDGDSSLLEEIDQDEGPELYRCPDCDGMYTVDRMDSSGFCVGCIVARATGRKVAATRKPIRAAKPNRVVKVAFLTIFGVIAVVFISLVIADNVSRQERMRANEKINENDQTLVDNAKQKDAQAALTEARPAPVPQPPVVHTPTRSELVDEDPVLSSIASRSSDFDDALRGTGSAMLGYNALHLAFVTNQLSYEEFEYAQNFRHSHGDYP